VLFVADLVTDDATDHRTTDRSHSAPLRQDGTRDATDAGADRGVLVLS
jgi:hypothetical protein